MGQFINVVTFEIITINCAVKIISCEENRLNIEYFFFKGYEFQKQLYAFDKSYC